MAEPLILIVMGPSGSGKTVLGRALSKATDLPFLEGDGHALRVQAQVAGGVVGSCSALRRAYRDHLRRAAGQPILFLMPSVARQDLRQRMEARHGHYMPASLLDSQLAILEPPQADEWSATLPAGEDKDTLLAKALDIVQAAMMELDAKRSV